MAVLCVWREGKTNNNVKGRELTNWRKNWRRTSNNWRPSPRCAAACAGSASSRQSAFNDGELKALRFNLNESFDWVHRGVTASSPSRSIDTSARKRLCNTS